MRHITQNINGFNGGGFSSQFSIGLDVGPVYKEIELVTNLNNDQLTQILVTLNGDSIVDVTGEELRMLETYKGNTPTDGRFIIPFADFSMKTQEGQDLTELVTVEGDNLTLTVKTGAATAAQTSASLVPTLRGLAVLGSGKVLVGPQAGQPRKRVTIPRLVSMLVQAGASGKNKYRSFTRGPRIRRMHIAGGTVTALEIKRDKITRFDDVLKADNDEFLERSGMVPQSGYYHFDAVATKFGRTDALQTAGASFEINPTVSSAGDVDTLFETIELV